MKHLIGFALVLLLAGQERPAIDSNCDGFDVRIVTDKKLYVAGSTMHVTMLLKNRSGSPLSLFRNAGQCSSQWGWFAVSLRDYENKEIESWPCSADDLQFGTRDLVQTLQVSESGILLKKGEIYGREEDFELPKRKGTFHVTAEIAPPAYLTDEQKEALARNHLRILRCACSSAPITITLK